MNMRRLIAFATLMMAGSALAVDSNSYQLRNGQDLVILCTVPAGDPLYPNAMGFCHGYLVGAFHYYDSTEPASNRFVCAPTPTPTRAEVMDGFVAWAKAHPQYMNDRPADTLFRYLAEKYPCAK
jgi:hypothetical protein